MSSSHEKPSLLPIIITLTSRNSAISGQPGDAGLSASTISNLVDGANLQALLPPSLRAACRSRVVGHLTDDEYGYDPIVAGFELVGPVDSAELAEARNIVAAALQPSVAAVVVRELTRLRFATASREFSTADMTMISAIYTEALVEVPEDIVISVCRDWPKRAKFWPALAELVEPAERLLVERRSLAEALARGPRKPPEPDPEEDRRRAAIEAQERRYAEAAAFRQAHPELMSGTDYGKPAPLVPIFCETEPPRGWRAEDASRRRYRAERRETFRNRVGKGGLSPTRGRAK